MISENLISHPDLQTEIKIPMARISEMEEVKLKHHNKALLFTGNPTLPLCLGRFVFGEREGRAREGRRCISSAS